MRGILSPALTGALSAFVLVMACTPNPGPPAATQGPDPLTTVRELLQLHDLVGKQPEERSVKTRKQEVDPKALSQLFYDFEADDPFLRELYIGFVIGVLARNQGRLFVSTHGNRAEIAAGKAKVLLKRDQDRYRIVLKESIPKEIVKRAKQEQARFKEKDQAHSLYAP